ncbi:hypothetical protein [Erysipelothrix anatis]|nr:hypothetical protein [Erysipelothrix anatis]
MKNDNEVDFELNVFDLVSEAEYNTLNNDKTAREVILNYGGEKDDE